VTQPASHHLDVYDAWLHLASTPSQWRRLQRKHGLSPDIDCDGHAQLFVDTGDRNTPHVAIWINHKAVGNGRGLVDTITHESLHAAAQLLDHIGQKADRHDSEALAYLVGFVAGWCWDNL
jgi:hypothetical protein